MDALCTGCQSKMRIVKSCQASKGLREIYAVCTSTDCSARALYHLSFDHYLQPPKTSFKSLLASIIGQLSVKERKELLREVLPSSNR